MLNVCLELKYRRYNWNEINIASTVRLYVMLQSTFKGSIINPIRGKEQNTTTSQSHLN